MGNVTKGWSRVGLRIRVKEPQTWPAAPKHRMRKDVPKSSITWHLIMAVLGLTSLATPDLVASELSQSTAKSPAGRPTVHLDKLEFPTSVHNHEALKRHLRRVLQREVRRVEWGAGRDNRIEYRFKVTKLSFQVQHGVLKVSCAATGILPGGKTAHSKLTFGGAPDQRTQVVKQVLEIVARGVIARLAELERQRRGLS